MLVPQSKKHQPEFDPAEAGRIYALAGIDKDIEGEAITSPHDLFSVEALRDRFALRVGRAVPADVFVFGMGEPPRPDCTQVGGKPYWPADRIWPADEHGSPYRFLAQINFADSTDLVGPLPGDLLLIFTGEEDDWYWEPMRVHFEWVPLGAPVGPEVDRSTTSFAGGPFFGAIRRTADYPDAYKMVPEPEIGRSYNLPILNGTKIGGVPHFIQGRANVSGQFLCQLGSIQAAAFTPYPWVNSPDPLGFAFDQTGIYGAENSMVFGDMGSFYIFRDAEGQVRSWFECY
jgi:hypothetical protein